MMPDEELRHVEQQAPTSDGAGYRFVVHARLARRRRLGPAADLQISDAAQQHCKEEQDHAPPKPPTTPPPESRGPHLRLDA